MREPLRLAVAQPQCVPHDVAANALAHAEIVRAAAARVVLFPELSLTGYELDAAAIGVDDARLAPIVTACSDMGAIALVGAPLSREDGAPFIAMLAVDGAGVRPAYRKVNVAPDELRFTCGPAPAVLAVDGFRFGLAICRDIDVPQHVSDTAALGIDAYLAGTVMRPEWVAYRAAAARRVAAAHRVWVATASFAGATGGGFDQTAGRSSIVNVEGQLVAEAGPVPGVFACATLL